MPYRALVLPDSRIAFWDAESTITQADPRAGVPASQQAGSMALGARGEQTAGTALEVRTQQGGHPIRGGAAYIYRHDGDTDAQWRSWDPPISISGWEAAAWTDGTGTPEWTRDPHAATSAGGALLVAVRYRDSSASDEYGVRVYRRPPGSSTWASADVWGQATAPTTPARSCLVVLPEGRIHLYSVIQASVSITVAMWYSDDDGLTWSYGGDVLQTAILSDAAGPPKIRAAYHRGQAMMLVESEHSTGISRRVHHYASDDMGLTFSLISVHTVGIIGGVATGGIALTASDAGFVVGMLGPLTGVDRGYWSTVQGDAFADLPFLSTEWTELVDLTTAAAREMEIGGNIVADMVTTDDGAVVFYWVDGDATTPTEVVGRWAVSWDGGTTWTSFRDPDYIASRWWDTDTPDYPSAISVASYRGRVALVGNWVATTGNEDDSIGVWWLGGWTSIPQPPLYRTTDWRTRACWSKTWTPIERPGDAGWTAVGTGTHILSAAEALALSCTSGQTIYYTRTPTGTIDQGIRLRLVVRPTSGGATTTNRHSVQLRLGDATNSYSVTLRCSTTQAQLYDDAAGLNVGAAMTPQNFSTSGAEFLIGLGRGEVAVYFREYDRADDDRLYEAGPSSTTLTDGGASTNRIEFGMRATSATTDAALWTEFHYASDDDVGAQTWATTTYPVDSIGRDYGDGTYTDAGVSVVARDGPTWRGEEWKIAARYDHGITRALQVSSPRATWRSTTTGAQVLALRLDSVGATNPESPYLGIPLIGSTLTRVLVETHNGTSWSTVGTVQLGWSGIGFSRAGQSAIPSGTAPGLWLDYGEARGASLSLSTSVARRVLAHGEGRWDPAYDLTPTLLLDEAVSGDPTSGTGSLTPEIVVVLVRVTSAIQGVRLTQAAPDASNPPPPDSFWQLGAIPAGWVRLLDDPDWGHQYATEAAVELDEARDRTTRSRKAGPTRRVRRISWASGARDLTEHRYGTPSERLSLGVHPVAASYGVPLSVPYLIERLSGGHTPVTYLASVPEDPGDLHVIRRRELILYGRTSDEAAMVVEVGEEGVDESATLGEMTITEEV